MALTVLAGLGGSSAALAQDAESMVYAAVKTCSGLEAYVRSYPDGRYRADAQARLDRDCAPAPAPDPCAQARADWAAIAESADGPVVEAFLTNAPEACPVQRTQARLRLDELAEKQKAAAAARIASDRANAEAREAKRRLWRGVPEFDGVWVQDEGPTCPALPWRYAPHGAGLRETTAVASYDLTVERVIPPTLRYANGARLILESDTRMRHEYEDGRLRCRLRKE